MPAGLILVADDDAAIRTVLNQALGRAGRPLPALHPADVPDAPRKNAGQGK